ncbi:NAD(P)-dependent alcohol dehydrogenase [Pleomorphovibrio marinus]|uniref:NAD(P)-dependent alcohol dehydrogenase n=1 Tax=Pleomorphovibrio marinus TaxID=2164132 RepID=UPI001E2E5CA8|nr:NAD(P)-dependent alcohol dehydrogenase [Pleomorphovibrio marinus]
MEVEIPIPKDNEVRVKIHTATVNRTDCGLRAAHPFITRFFTGLFKPKNTILGSEFSGDIDAIGKDVKSFTVGEKVFGLSESNFGAHAEYLCIAENASISTLPETLTAENALAICEGPWYAWNNLKKANLEPGKKILINGGSGSIGSSAIQIAAYFGVEITAVTNTKNLNLVKNLGATHAIDYSSEDFTKLNRQFDVVFDAVGKSSYFNCKKLLKPNGIYFSTELGPFMQNPLLALWTSAFGTKKVLFPIPVDKRENILFFKELAEKGFLIPVIDKVYPLDQIVEAYKYVESEQKTGSVLLKIRD